ncbi:MAG: sigma-70 family RNA polymerase sigma factor [Propioniciclava sp.]|uniref:RNA polymerase sigma factor n=1 Tax=Propioniciclava sp. TaxID=2038686 RepID=UPI0039E42CCC
MNNTPAPSEADFRALYERTSPRVYGYVRRRCPESDCDDVVADAYLTAWRHFGRLPDDPVPWLIGAARNALANHRRSTARQVRVSDELRAIDAVARADCADKAVARTDLLNALAQLSEDDREILLLAGWDGLTSHGIATVLGISAVTARARLSRARRRLQRHYAPRPEARPFTPRSLLTESH